MPNVSSTFQARVVSYMSRNFESFTNRANGEMVPGGVTERLWLLEDESSEPVACSIAPALRPSLVNLRKPEAFGVRVLVRCTAYAKGNRIDLRVESLELVESKLKAAQ
jgi:hypothetical protein